MVTVYNYSLSSDFVGGLTPNQLWNEIEADTNIAPTCLIVFNVGDNVDIKFDSALSGSEQTALNILVSSHTPITHQGYSVTNISISNYSITDITYTTVTSFNFPGTNVMTDISHMKIISMMEEGGTSYDVKVYDVTNNKQLAVANFNNTDESICDMGTLSNLPTGEAIVEIMAKVNGNTDAYIKNISIHYDM